VHRATLVPVVAPPSTFPAGPDDAVKAQQLAVMKRRATGALVAVTLVFLLSLLFDGTWAEYLRAAAEASMVGGLADWFAVTALFRHPLGLPIPHTAVIPERKDQFGLTLGEFVQRNFLSSDTLGERVRTARVADRVAAWLADPGNAANVAGRLADAAAWGIDLVEDDDVHVALESVVRRQADNTRLAPLAGRALRALTATDRHHEVLGAAVAALDRFLEENRETLRTRYHRESPWWIPGTVDDRIFDRLVDGARRVLGEVAADPDHELRKELDRRLRDLADQLEHSPELLERGEQLKTELLGSPELRKWTRSVWEDAKVALQQQAREPDSEVRRRLATTIVGLGRRLQEDPALRTAIEASAERGARYVAEHFHDEITGLVTSTVQRWDAQETSGKLELLLGRDLQFIRINGTVVGGLAGLAIHAVAELLT
jgi:uncharacterized membrane-anchored protein YjiN (DUF445 family)